MEDTSITDFEAQAQAMEALVAHLRSLHWEQLRLVKSLGERREAAHKMREFMHMLDMEIPAKERELREVVASHDQSLEDAQSKQQLQNRITMLMCKREEKGQLLSQFKERLATDMVIIRDLEEKLIQCLHSILMGEMTLQRLCTQFSHMKSDYRQLVEKVVRAENKLREERSKSKTLEEENDKVKRQLVEKDRQLVKKDRQLVKKDRQLEEKDRQLVELDEENKRKHTFMKVGGVLLSATVAAAAALWAGVI